MARPSVRLTPSFATLAAACAAVTFLPVVAHAADATWSNPVSGRWLVPANWSTGAVPNSIDSATINTPGAYTVTLDGGTTTGPVTLDNPDATLLLAGSAALSPQNLLISAGTTVLHAGSNGTQSSMTPPGGAQPFPLTNHGRLELRSDYPGSSSFWPHTLVRATVVNTGTITAYGPPAPTPTAPFWVVHEMAGSGRTFTNTGSVQTSGYAHLVLRDYVFNQNAGTLAGVLEFEGGTFNYNGGSVAPNSFVTLDNAVVNLNPAATGADLYLSQSQLKTTLIPAGNAVTVNHLSSVTVPGSLTNAGRLAVGYALGPTTNTFPSPTLRLQSASSTLTNTGTLEINHPNLMPVSIVGSITNQGTVAVHSSHANFSTLAAQIDGEFTNAGQMTVDPDGRVALKSAYNFTQNSGSLTIAPSGSLALTNAKFYYNGGTVSGPVTLDNSTVHFAPTLTTAGGTFTTTGPGAPFTGNIPAGATVVHAPTLTQTVSLPSFTNAGSLRTALSTGSLRSTYTLATGTGTLTNTGSMGGNVNNADRGIALFLAGNLTNTGDIKANFLTVSGSLGGYRATVNQNAGTLHVDGYYLIYYATLNYNGGTITGRPVGLNNSTLNIAPGTNPASFSFFVGSNTLVGSISPGFTIALDTVLPASTTVAVNAPAPLANAGTLAMGATHGTLHSTLSVTGPLTNTGTLSVTKGLGGTRTLNADILNTGTITIGPGTTLTYSGNLTTSTPLDLQGTLLLKSGTLTWDHPDDAPAASLDALRAHLAAGRLAAPASDTHRLSYTLTPDGSSLLVQLSPTGDADADGTLDADDYALLDRGLAAGGTHWSDGDFDYDGTVDPDDYLLLDAAVAKQQGGTPAPALLALREAQFGADYVSRLMSSVPEPSSAACVLAAVALTTRRRRDV